jgi:ketosteroid isomerase-like protein
MPPAEFFHGGSDMTRRFNTWVVVLVILAGPLIAVGVWPAAVSAQQASVEQTLRGLSEQWAQVPVTRDVAVLRRIWAPDFVYVEPSGRVFNKEEGIVDVAKSTDKYTSAQISGLKVRVYGTGAVAVVIGDDREIGRDKDGKAFDRKSKFTNIWVLQNGLWQCVSGHSSDLPSK